MLDLLKMSFFLGLIFSVGLNTPTSISAVHNSIHELNWIELIHIFQPKWIELNWNIT